MAVYCKPSYNEPLTVFNNKYFVDNCPTIDTAFLNTNYLKYPIAQGNENFINTTTGENIAISPTGLNSVGGYDITVQSSNQINLNSYDNINMNCGVNIFATASDNIIFTANNDSISFQADDNVTLVSSGQGNINLDAPNINSYNFSMPICFDFIETDRNYNYTSGGQNWEQIWQQNLNVPKYFFTEYPQSGYTSNIWKIDFSLNTWSTSNTNQPDKALSYYIDIQDQNGNTYSTPIFNKSNPFCYHNNNSTWSQGNPLTQFIPFSWTDIIDFSPLGGTGSGNLPLRFNVYISADNPRQFSFSYKLSITRTNLL